MSGSGSEDQQKEKLLNNPLRHGRNKGSGCYTEDTPSVVEFIWPENIRISAFLQFPDQLILHLFMSEFKELKVS